MASILLKLRTWWETADRTQKAVTLFGSVFLVALLAGTIFFAGRPKMDMLFGGLTPAEQGMVNAELQKMGIPTTIDAQGDVFVPNNQVAEAKSRLATAGKLPQSGHSGNADLEKLNMMVPPGAERERLKSIAEGELAKSIEAIKGVSSARVHLTLVQRGPFAESERPASASILITEQAGDGVDAAEARAISRMVANAVPELKPDNITILNANGQLLWDGSTESGVAGHAEQKVQAEIAEARRRRAQIQSALDAAFGPGATVVTVNVVMDFDKQFINQTENTPSEAPSSIDKQTETMADPGAATPLAGLAGNTGAPTINDGNGAKSGGYQGENTSQQFEVNRKESRIEKSAGELLGMSINVLIDQTKIKDSTPVDEYIQGYLQPWSGNAKFVGTVTPVTFDTTAKLADEKLATAASGRDRMQQMMSFLPIAALFIVGFLVIKAISKTAKSQNVMVAAMPGGQLMPMNMASGAISGGGANLALPDGSLAPVPIQQAIMAQDIHIDDIPDKVNVPLEQIRKMAENRPQVVAMLMKTWLLEEKR